METTTSMRRGGFAEFVSLMAKKATTISTKLAVAWALCHSIGTHQALR
ncbi:hypothetical protein N2603_38035 [Bradyrhizobium huanghuaihaiense]|nr:hypothetical protein [Bradyrhizobium sp. CB3035]UWU75733.1 hypothetical protein N2603_38035 [Bradyrhizobium sp. CB3035]